MSSGVTVQSGGGTQLMFTVTGTHTLAYAQAFAAAVKGLTVAGGMASVHGGAQAAAPVEYSVTTPGSNFVVPAGGNYTLDSASGPTTITGSGAGDTVLAVGINAHATYFDKGGDNTVTFVDGNNHYIGDSVSAPGARGYNVVVTGSGFDTVDTGAGKTVVFSGTGSSVINLNDTVTSGINDFVVLDDGKSVVNQHGVNDAVYASAFGQTINGGVAGETLMVAIEPDSVPGITDPTIGNQLVNANGANVTIFDRSSGSSIYGGTGQLIFVGQSSFAGNRTELTTITSGTGSTTTAIFGASGDSITALASDSTASVVFVAGAGNETLNGGGSTGGIAFYANTASSNGGLATTESMVGGAGHNYFFTGGGSETLVGGSGVNNFFIDKPSDGSAANITINNFTASDYITVANGETYTSVSTVTGGGSPEVQLTFTDGTVVSIVGVSDITGHIA